MPPVPGVPDSSRGPDPTPFPFFPKTSRVRVSDFRQQQPSRTSPDGLSDVMIYPVAGEELSASGSAGSAAGGGGSSPTSEGPDSRMSPTSAGSDGPSAFPPLPPPPPPPPGYGAHGSVDESDQQDGPEVEEEEAVFSLSAPPTNQ